MAIANRLESFLTDANQRMIRHARRFKSIYVLIAAVLFFGGVTASAWMLNLNWGQLEIRWLLLNMLAGAPAAIALNAIGLKVSAAIVGATLSFSAAFRTCCIAICSSLLPIPAGSVVQVSSLASRGGSVLQSGVVITVGNAISLSLVMVLLGAIMALEMFALGTLILVTGIAVFFVSAALVLRKTTSLLAFYFIAVRVFRTLISVVRIQLSFLVIGLVIGIFDAALFAGAVAFGTLLTVFPGGLGISEVFAATLAIATTIAPEAAFLAIAVNRMSTLLFAAVVVGFNVWRGTGK